MKLNLDVENDQQRKAFRTRVPGFFVRIHDSGQIYAIKDLSATGFAIFDESKPFMEGETHVVDLYLKKKPFLEGLQGRVMRVVPNGIIGWNFEDMDRRQEMRLDKLVLEVQKRLIQMKKQKDRE